jgi:hypothetical protein
MSRQEGVAQRTLAALWRLPAKRAAEESTSLRPDADAARLRTQPPDVPRAAVLRGVDEAQLAAGAAGTERSEQHLAATAQDADAHAVPPDGDPAVAAPPADKCINPYERSGTLQPCCSCGSWLCSDAACRLRSHLRQGAGGAHPAQPRHHGGAGHLRNTRGNGAASTRAGSATVRREHSLAARN